MKFNDLSIQEKAAVIKLGVGGGLHTLLDIALFWDGMQGPDDPPVVQKVNKSKADFVQRLKDKDRAYIQDWENPNNIATHKLSWAEDDNGAIVYPNVQNVNGRLVDFSRPPYNTWAGYDNAVRNGDTIHMTPEEAEWFTTHYKDYYPGFDEYKKGGSIHIKPENRGKFNATKKRTGKTTEELTHSKNPLTRKRAIFALNARKWHRKDSGGYLNDIIWDNMGLLSHPGLITGIIGSSVVEYPLKYQFGGLFKKKEIPNYLYTTYGLNDYGQPRYEGSYNNPVFGYQPLSGINQSIGRDYSMPDYGAVAYTSYPIYMNPSILTSDTDKETLAKQYLTNFVLQDGIENTMNSKYYDNKRDRWTPQNSVEGGTKTIGKGLKMNNTNTEWYKTLEKQGYLTNALMEAGVNEMIGGFYGKARDIYNNRVGVGAWDKLDANKQALLMDYAYNGVLGLFNNFMDAVAADDKDRILKEYVRHSGGKRLGKRNDETLNWINSIWPDTYQYGGPIKPFSYLPIPEVRY